MSHYDVGRESLVSVVVATYNLARFLPDAIASILSQSYQNIEIIVIDDGSTDNTQHVIKPFLEDSRVQYYYQDNQGQASAKNHGIRMSKGTHVAFLDADDAWRPDKLKLQMPLFGKSSAVGVVYSRVQYMGEAGNELEVADNMLFRGEVSGRLFIENFIGFGSCVVKRDCFDRLGVFRDYVKMGIDYDLWLRFSSQFEFDFVDRPLLCYRLWGGQMSRNCKGRFLSGIAIMKRFLEEFPDVIDSRTEREAWAHTYVGFGQCLQEMERSIGPALALYLRALRYRPTYLPAWISIIKAFLRPTQVSADR